MTMSTDLDWLKKKAEQEDEQYVGVGGHILTAIASAERQVTLAHDALRKVYEIATRAQCEPAPDEGDFVSICTIIEEMGIVECERLRKEMAEQGNEVVLLRAELKAQKEIADIYQRGQQNACAHMDAIREACAKIAEGKMVDADATGAWTDIAYNQACRDIAAEIRRAK